jgi:hypothetical protein
MICFRWLAGDVVSWESKKTSESLCVREASPKVTNVRDGEVG